MTVSNISNIANLSTKLITGYANESEGGSEDE
jgi:hypothetical protein